MSELEVASAFHVSVLVDDIQGAIAHHEERLGIQFTEISRQVCYITYLDREPKPVELNVAYSRTATPYIELIQTSPSGVYAVPSLQQIHHLAYWEPNIPARIERLRAQGTRIDAYLAVEPGGPPVSIYTAVDPSLGVRFEYADERFRPFVQDWVRMGRIAGV